MDERLTLRDARPGIDGVPLTTQNDLLATRIIVEALAEPSQEFSVAALAKRTELSNVVVSRVLCSEQFRALIADACRDKVSGVLLKSVARVDQEIICNPGAKPHHLLDAMRSLTQTYAVLTKAAPSHDAGQAEDDFRKFLAGLRPADVTISKVTNANQEREEVHRQDRRDP